MLSQITIRIIYIYITPWNQDGSGESPGCRGNWLSLVFQGPFVSSMLLLLLLLVRGSVGQLLILYKLVHIIGGTLAKTKPEVVHPMC